LPDHKILSLILSLIHMLNFYVMTLQKLLKSMNDVIERAPQRKISGFPNVRCV